MTGCPQAVRSGFRHDAVLYRSDQEFLDVVAPFLEEGLAAGEPAVVALSNAHAALVHSALPVATGITFLPDGFHDSRPAVAIRAYQDLFSGHLADGADGIRMVGEVPHPGVGAPWDGWACYEAVINRAYQAFPLWSLCFYDRRTSPAEILHEVERTHPHLLVTADGYVESDHYEDPVRFMAGRSRASPETLESEPPSLILVQPRPAVARHAVAELCEASDLDAPVVDDLIVAVSEVVTNAIRHGRAPTTLQAWAASRHVVVTVHDTGPGPSDPFVGLLPAKKDKAEGGFGLWIAHQLCHRVTLDSDDNGFTVRLVAAKPPLRRR